MDNREKILKCALNLFYTKGYDAVGVHLSVNLKRQRFIRVTCR